ncbi:hypothetical protein HaLaN_25116 [Haematococcus lacustris]|uniref:Uncharacterized protein n=1 Tax=Haematococcus lacustris TaxID=44745 RepID=A0A699ZWP6_HAELA|nr:hypothetical protein HaLaN_25116 [Haematococcus lacustris]
MDCKPSRDVLGTAVLATASALATMAHHPKRSGLGSGSRGWDYQLTPLSVKSSDAGATGPLPLIGAKLALGAAGRVTGGGGGRQVSRARATFSVLESSQVSGRPLHSATRVMLQGWAAGWLMAGAGDSPEPQ